MTTYILARTDQGGGYVAVSGSKSSYTRDLRRAQRWPTKEAARDASCVENEVPVPLESLLQPPGVSMADRDTTTGCGGTGFPLAGFWEWFFRGTSSCRGCEHPDCPAVDRLKQ